MPRVQQCSAQDRRPLLRSGWPRRWWRQKQEVTRPQWSDIFLLKAAVLCRTLWWRWSPSCGSTSSVRPSPSSDLAGRSPLVDMTAWGHLTQLTVAAAPGLPADWQHRPLQPKPLLTGYRRIWCPPLSAPGCPAELGGPKYTGSMNAVKYYFQLMLSCCNIDIGYLSNLSQEIDIRLYRTSSNIFDINVHIQRGDSFFFIISQVKI